MMHAAVLRTVFAAVLVTACGAAAAAEEEILVADFEGTDYGDWEVTGDAFGPGPAQGTLPNQMPVVGFEGKGLVNSFHGRDRSTGTLTSPPFTIQRKHVNFLIGGGWHPGETCINLVVEGKVARTATGPNREPGGTERLDPYGWDVSELLGKTARIQIVDQFTGGWGHINIDHIRQSDRRTGPVATVREVAIEHDYMAFQIGAGQGPRSSITLLVDDEPVRSFAGTNPERPQWISWDVTRLKGRRGKLKIEEVLADDDALVIHDSLTQVDRPKGTLFVVDKLYQETYRPQFHFTPKKNWTNDPNGLVYYDGEYHLFFQHNPEGIKWGNMTWGHAVSRDLVHWRQLDHAIYPDEHGTIFSGSAVVDHQNTLGLPPGPHAPLVCVFSYAGRFGTPERPYTQGIAYSVDRGRTFTKHPEPVLENLGPGNRDPKVFWHPPTKRWVMVLYLGERGKFVLMASKNLKQWTRLSDVEFPDGHECPELFELPVDGDPDNTRWVFWEGGGRHMIGRFDGRRFTAESDALPSKWGRNCYAGQTWNDVPDGRRIFIAWMAGGQYPGMPFNQQMSVPRVFTLRTTGEGIRLFALPIREIEQIRRKEHAWSDFALTPGDNPLSELDGQLWDVDAAIEPGTAEAVELGVRGHPIRYDVKAGTLSCMGSSVEVPLDDGRLALRVLVDRTTIEIFAAGGRYVMSFCFVPDLLRRDLSLSTTGGTAKVHSLNVWELASIWEEQKVMSRRDYMIIAQRFIAGYAAPTTAAFSPVGTAELLAPRFSRPYGTNRENRWCPFSAFIGPIQACSPAERCFSELIGAYWQHNSNPQ